MGDQDEVPVVPPVDTAPANTVPQIGHICWFGPHDPPKECIDSWSEKNPGVMWSLWRDHTQFLFNKEQIAVRGARGEWNGVCDVIRYELLVRYGGVCVDADSTAMKPLAEGDFFEATTALACWESESARPGIVACGFLAAPKGHPFFQACIEEAEKADPKEAAWASVGPMLVTRIAQRMPEAIRVVPSRMFIPEHYTGAKALGTAPIYASQHFGSTTTYNKLRKWACQCQVCRSSNQMIRSSWG